MIAFLDQISLTPHPQFSELWVSTKDFKFTYNDYIVTIPEGFITDLASIPSSLWAIFPPFGLYTTAAVIHDFIYSRGGVIYNTIDKDNITRRLDLRRIDADNILYEAMIACKVSKLTAKIIYQAVRIFGGSHWVDLDK